MTLTIQSQKSEFGLKIILIILAGVSSMLFFVGPWGIVPFDIFGMYAIIPSVIAIFAIGILLRSKFPRITIRLFGGMAAGAIATFGLEIIRIPSYQFLRWIPMDSMISLPGLLLTGMASTISEAQKLVMQSGIPMNLYHAPLDAFMAGALWHFWNGATFGIVYALVVGKGKWWYGLIWGIIIEIGMMLAPYLIMMKGPFGIQHMDGYNIFVITLIAHLIFGAILGILVRKFVKNSDKNYFEKIDNNTDADVKSEFNYKLTDEHKFLLKGSYKRYGVIGSGSGLLSCTCVVIPLVLISISASLASFVISILGSFDVFFIIFGTIVFVSILTFDLKRKKALSLEKINLLKWQIIFSVSIFVVLTSILILAVAPILMGELQRNM